MKYATVTLYKGSYPVFQHSLS